MNQISSDPHVDIQNLKVGMFVHLDLGWMSHPFPRGSFKISDPGQIETIRTLGLKRLRWSPEKSDLDEPAAGAMPGQGVGLHTWTGAEADAQRLAAESAPTGDVTASPPADASTRRRSAVAEQREARRECERRFTEASGRLRQALYLTATQPEQAGDQTEALTRDVVEKLLGDREMSIRLLSESSNDRSSLHAMNVAVISLLLGRAVGLGEEELLDIGVGALLHDIGKLALPERVRHREDHFTTSELDFYQSHVAQGVSAGRRMRLRPGALLVIGQHHEHADGSGFPQRLQGDRLTTATKIVALVNRYDNLCNPALPSRALTPHEALSLLFAQGRHKFDAAIMGSFIKMMGVYPPGSTVQLTDDRYGLVTAVSSHRPLKPRVLVHDPSVPAEEALIIDLETLPGVGIRRSLKPSQLPRAVLEALAPRERVVYFFEPAVSMRSEETPA